MRSVSILSVAGLLALAAAQPAQKRDMVTVTEVDTVVKTVDVTSTVYANAGSTPSAAAPPAGGKHQHHGHQHKNKQPKPSKQPEQQPKQHPSSQAPPPPPPPQPTTTVVPVATHSPPPAPPKPTTTAVPEPPKQPPPPSGGAPSDSFSGDMTFYTPGLGSCGITNTESDHIVALAVPMMNNGANPNTNPKCNQKITIEYNGKKHEATVTDTCWACAREDIDLSPSLFQEFSAESVGRVPGVKWWFNDASFM